MFEVTSGNIIANVKYQVTGAGTFITYNAINYNIGEFFTGTGITTYTKDTETEVVTEASTLTDSVIEIQAPIFEGLFPDVSTLTDSVIEIENIVLYPADITITDFTQNEKNFIPAESLIFISHNEIKITEIFGTMFNDGINFDALLAFESDPNVAINLDVANNIKSVEVNNILIFTVQR